MKKSEEKTMASDHDTWFMVLVAIRYCIGRRSYAPGLATEWVKRYWNLIPLSSKHLLLRDVSEEVSREKNTKGWLGDDCDRATWVNFEEWLRAHIQKEQS